MQVETLFWSSILNPVQSALISLHTYPHHAHVSSIMEVLVSQQSRNRHRAAAVAESGLQPSAAMSCLYSVAAQPIVEAMPG